MTVDESFRRMLEQHEAASEQLVSGNAAPWKELASHGDDCTVFGAWGGYERGWEQVGPRYDWASGRFTGGRTTREYLSTWVADDLACTIAIERGEVRYRGSDEPREMALRVTQVYRREGGAWKLVHRHADPLKPKDVDRVTPH